MSKLGREMESLEERLKEAVVATASQMELTEERKADVAKLRKNLEE